MASNTRKKVFPKPPQRFHSGLERTLGKNSNKTCREANLKGIYHRHVPKSNQLTEAQEKHLQKIKERLNAKAN